MCNSHVLCRCILQMQHLSMLASAEPPNMAARRLTDAMVPHRMAVR